MKGAQVPREISGELLPPQAGGHLWAGCRCPLEISESKPQANRRHPLRLTRLQANEGVAWQVAW